MYTAEEADCNRGNFLPQKTPCFQLLTMPSEGCVHPGIPEMWREDITTLWMVKYIYILYTFEYGYTTNLKCGDKKHFTDGEIKTQ